MPYNNLVQSVLRGMDIILEIGKADKGVTLRELAQNLNLKTPTLHNLLRTLKARGFVRQCPGEARYVLGQTLFDLTALHAGSRLVAEAEKRVRALFDEMQPTATVTFSEQIGGEIRTILRMSPDQPAVMQKPRQQALNSYASATALILHAFGNDDDRAIVQERYPFQECSGQYANDPEQFKALLKQIRKQGYACKPSLDPGQIAMAAPVLGAAHELLGIIGLSLRNTRGAENKETIKQTALNRLLAAAQDIARGWAALAENRAASTGSKTI